MTVYVDEIRHYPATRWSRKHWCHMVTDGPMDELHDYARRLGVPARRLHDHAALPHYDLTPDERDRALARGARPVGRREMAGLLRRARPPALRALIGSQLDGVSAVERIASRLSPADWARQSPCELWTARDVAAHLRANAHRYAELLDQAASGTVTGIVVHDELAARNAAAIAALPPDDGPGHAAAFCKAARRVAQRFAGAATLGVHRWPDGRVMTGRDLAVVAAKEWHVHAWDLAAAVGASHVPTDPGTLAAGWRTSIFTVDLPPGDAWTAVLRASGRVTS